MADGGDLKREFLGQPVWIWAVAGAVAVAAAVYLYRRNARQAGKGGAAASEADGGTADGTAATSGVSSLYGWLLDHQSSPTTVTTTKTTCPKGYRWNAKTRRCVKAKAA